MKRTELAFHRIVERKLIALLSPKTAEQCLSVYENLDPLGVTLEVAFRSEAAGPGIRAVLARHPEALVLAGTVMTPAQVGEALAAGAAGIISADYVPEVVDACVEADVMCVPGGLADAGKQLARKAAGYGCGLAELRERHPYQWIYKLFPAVAGGTSFAALASAWRGPFPGLAVVYTGGVNRRNLTALAAADPAGIFCGSALTENSDDPEALRTEARLWAKVLAG
jgi:2-dehydro-3-deoxyphosphogluconate aldolase/(4S)-4-hydroxy-2-oxoglutarate aldolase